MLIKIVPENICCKCQKFKVSNKTYRLCKICNYERTHQGQSLFEVSLKKQKESKANRVLKMQNSILKDPLLNDKCCSIIGCINTQYTKKFGGLCYYHFQNEKKNQKGKSKRKRQQILPTKQQTIKSELSKIKIEEKTKHFEKTGNTCEGCDKSFQNLDYSHILSVKQRQDLELVRENKNLLCRSCHNKWESWSPEEMFSLKCILYNLNYIRQMDTETFWRIYYKCIDHVLMTEAKIMEQIDEEFTKNNNG